MLGLTTFAPSYSYLIGLLGMVMKTSILFLASVLLAGAVTAQGASEKPINDNEFADRVLKAAELQQSQKLLLDVKSLQGQLSRAACQLPLPKAQNQPLSPAEVCQRAREATIGIGTLYLCEKCSHWHTNIAGGYAVTEDGVVATAYHVLRSDDIKMREGYFIAVDVEGNVYAVKEVLAGNQAADVALVRTTATGRKPLALNTDVRSGDSAFCLSSPQGRQQFFSSGMVSRFYLFNEAVFLNVTTDWATGSSGSAVLDACGNAIGHVASTRTLLSKSAPEGVQMTLKNAASAQELLKLCLP